jgi:hypothetical protein
MENPMGWAVYAGSVLLFIALGFRVSRPWPPGLRWLLRCLAIATVVPVAPAGAAGDYLVPAVIAALFEGIVQKSGDATAALQILGISWGLALCVAAFLAFLEERRGGRA